MSSTIKTEQKTIYIQTLTPLYDKVEDRIRLSINYQDIANRIDLMITRAFILQLLPIFEEFIYKHYPESIDDEDYIHIDASTLDEDTIEPKLV